jgi:hypothetical protein
LLIHCCQTGGCGCPQPIGYFVQPTCCGDALEDNTYIDSSGCSIIPFSLSAPGFGPCAINLPPLNGNTYTLATAVADIQQILASNLYSTSCSSTFMNDITVTLVSVSPGYNQEIGYLAFRQSQSQSCCYLFFAENAPNPTVAGAYQVKFDTCGSQSITIN